MSEDEAPSDFNPGLNKRLDRASLGYSGSLLLKVESYKCIAQWQDTPHPTPLGEKIS